MRFFSCSTRSPRLHALLRATRRRARRWCAVLHAARAPARRGLRARHEAPLPALRPGKLWYERPIYYMGNHLSFVPGRRDVIPWPSYTKRRSTTNSNWARDRHPHPQRHARGRDHATGGFVVVNDFSARDVQYPEMNSGFVPGEGEELCQRSMRGRHRRRNSLRGESGRRSEGEWQNLSTGHNHGMRYPALGGRRPRLRPANNCCPAN
ncbi:MAG: hypothetical protein U0232_19895 [Thermomicrobiales bacterium]